MDVAKCTLQQLLDEFKLRATEPALAANEWKKKTGGKVVGVAGLDVPEPLIHAAGMLPVVLLDRDEEVTVANAHVEMHQCGYIRSLVDQAMKGELTYCDELLFHDCCHIVRMLCDAMHTFADCIPKVKFCYFPPMLEYKNSQNYARDEYKRLRKRLEDMSGNEITDEKLTASLKIFNEQKLRLIKLYDIRREYPGILCGEDVSNIVAAGMCMPKEDHIVLLDRLLELLEDEKKKPVSTAIPVVVHGSLCERLDGYVFRNIEQCGGVVVDDDLYVGSKYFNTLYKTELDPIEALLDAYIHRVSPCPTRYEERNPGEYLAGMVEKAKAKGIIMVVVKFCEAHDYLYFTAHRYFEQHGVHEMLVETEQDSAPEGQLKTRLQGFFESLEG